MKQFDSSADYLVVTFVVNILQLCQDVLTALSIFIICYARERIKMIPISQILVGNQKKK